MKSYHPTFERILYKGYVGVLEINRVAWTPRHHKMCFSVIFDIYVTVKVFIRRLRVVSKVEIGLLNSKNIRIYVHNPVRELCDQQTSRCFPLSVYTINRNEQVGQEYFTYLSGVVKCNWSELDYFQAFMARVSFAVGFTLNITYRNFRRVIGILCL